MASLLSTKMLTDPDSKQEPTEAVIFHLGPIIVLLIFIYTIMTRPTKTVKYLW